ncbi:MAG: adenylate/guanylate cyclase domain-containing protein [Anaerolineales bacterium]|jgi:class 3 adenylate cyclase
MEVGPSREAMDLKNVFDRPPKVLIVDDDWLNRDLLKAYLTASGCEVVTAADGKEALERALDSPPDLTLADVQMPNMDGLELCRLLKSTRATRFVPVVIVTALDSEEEKLKAIEAGADDFVSKPYNAVVLLTRVRSLLRIKQLNDEVEARNRLLRQVLNRYVAEDVADVILTDPDRHLKLGGELRNVTVMFADIRGFTSYTERHSATEVIHALNRIFQSLSEAVFQHHGTFDKYLGDGLMAFYGAPVAAGDDAQRALDSALDMHHRFNVLKKESERDFAGLGLGIGLHTGDAVVGNIGSDRVMDYTVVGDAVNVSKRLQELSRSGQIVMSEATYNLVKAPDASHLEGVQLPGREGGVDAYLVAVPPGELGGGTDAAPATL